MRMSIVIVNWNTEALLSQCLASILAHPPEGDYEVVVVDNASTDGSVAMVRDEFPSVTLLANEKNVGFAAGNNLAMEACTADMVLLLNSDTVMRPGALETLRQFMERHPEAGAAGARLLNV